eukprot:TRINITY_DN73750_c0_g1_i1.p1 TRINITY_DN73750_c0_g1~~TRINITY_DN73750_c0_g1_i1.p1  ORF type:complete len:307 (-),score=46.09 TRINITY_DN73750_c0_g1_i1:6-926(-)
MTQMFFRRHSVVVYACLHAFSLQSALLHATVTYRLRRGGGRASLSQGCAYLGETVCTQNNVTVLESRTDEGRSMRLLKFGDECATESKVVCRFEGSCTDDCSPCPCKFDASAEPSAPYMRVMFEHLGQLCASKSDVRVLVIGLGGGELPQFLLHRCPQMYVEAVELNGDVISLARTYFGIGEAEREFDGRLQIEQADALSAVSKRAAASPGSYDAVLVDCFAGGGEVPESCRSSELAQRVHDTLKGSGVMMQNIWHYSAMRSEVAEQFTATKDIYKSVFSGSVEDLLVPMPASIRWVDILKMTKEV